MPKINLKAFFPPHLTRLGGLAFLLHTLCSPLHATLLDPGVYLLPRNCNELLPESGPFLHFFRAVGVGLAQSNPRMSNQIFKITGFRERLSQAVNLAEEENPVDVLVRKTLCFYRQQKDPISPIAYDDPEFLSFLKGSLPELQTSIEKVVLRVEVARQKRLAYEKKLQKNRQLIETMQMQGEKEANQTYDRLQKSARREALGY